MLTLVADVCQRQQLTLLMVSHSVEDAARIAPRSIVVAEGRIAWDGATDDLLAATAAPRRCWELARNDLMQYLKVDRHQGMAEDKR